MKTTAHSRSPGARTRRRFLQLSAAAGVALLLPGAATAGQFRLIEGDVRVNGAPADAGTQIHALDVIVTGTNAKAVLVMGKDAFLIRANSEVELLGKPKAVLLNGLRMLTGALLGVFGKGEKQLLTATATIGIRGTGIYMEASAEQTYFCTCYGTVRIVDQHRAETNLVAAGYHTPNMIFAQMTDGAMMQKAAFKNHTDDELVMLEKLVGRKPPFVRP